MIAAARARLDNEIAALTQALCSRRTERNALATICRLPPEILASIFIHYAHASYKEHPCKPRVPSWVNVSYVCRHWRNVALNCPTLWSFLFVCSKRWTNELLARSGTAPLNLRMDIDKRTPVTLDLLRKVALRTHHIRDFHVRLPWYHNMKNVTNLPFLPAPLLQNLRVSFKMPKFRSDDLPVTARSLSLFNGDTPALRTLDLENYPFPFKFAPLRSLTFLRLRDFDTSSLLTLAELKVALSHMQDLVHLHLEDVLPSARDNSTGPSFEDSKKLSFPRLLRLSIIAPFSTVVLLLSCFDVPVHTQVRLRCREEEGTDYTPIYPLLAGRLVPLNQGSVLVPIIRTCVIGAGPTTVHLIFSTAERDDHCTFLDLDSLDDWGYDIPLALEVELQPSGTSREARGLLVGTCRNIHLAGLQSVHVTLDWMASPASWMYIVGHFKDLVHMQLYGMSFEKQGLVQLLSTASHHPTDEGGTSESRVFAPALEELEFVSVKFSKKCGGRSRGGPDNCSCIACLCDALSARHADGHGLRRLVLQYCTEVYRRDVEALRAVMHVTFHSRPGFEEGGDME